MRLHRFNPDQMCPTGQVIRQVISLKAKHGPRLRELPKVSVRLTVDAGTEDQEVFRHHGTHGLRRVQICRMIEGAMDQGGVLTQEDLADILQVNVRTIRRAIKELRELGIKVQTRGIYHDIGPSICHKAWVVRLYLEYKTYSEISRITRHSPTAIKRYITDFARVSTKKMSIPEVAHIVGISERMAKEYTQLYIKYNSLEHRERIEDLIVKAVPHGEKGGSLVS